MLESKHHKMLILEDDEDFSDSLVLELQARGIDAFAARNWLDIDQDLLSDTGYALVDLRLERDSGLECIRRLKQANPEMVIVLITGYGTIPSATAALKLGAKDYLTKPVSIKQILESFFDSQPVDTKHVDTAAQRQSLSRHEQEYIEYVLEKCRGNITHAAQWLGIRRQSLQRKLKKYPDAR